MVKADGRVAERAARLRCFVDAGECYTAGGVSRYIFWRAYSGFLNLCEFVSI